MKILVPTKRVADPDQKIRVRSDGLGIVEDDLPFVINPFDEVAIEEAIRIGEESSEPVEVVAVGIGSQQYEQQLRTALAMGADRAVLVLCEAPLDSWNVACILRQIVEREAPHLVLMGKQAVDDDANQAGQFLAALLDWPQATFASRIEFAAGGVRVARETDAGIETVRFALPAVITTDLRLNEPRYAALPSILRARKKPLEQIGLEELGTVVEPRLRVLGLEPASSSRNCVHLDSAGELVRRLRESKAV